MTFFNDFFGYISRTYIWGIPLDTTLHVLVGFLVTYFGLKMKISFGRVFFFLLIIESLKAISAAMTIDHNIAHGLKEFFATFIYPFWVWIFRKLKPTKELNQKKSFKLE